MRGKAAKILKELEASGITPAYAGKSSVFPRSSVILEDHPRLCGEKSLRHLMHRKFQGSPPPMRGKATSFTNFSNFIGITPAYAGKSSHYHSHRCNSRDHPRLCGEKCIFFEVVRPTGKSPPPMRGKVYQSWTRQK